MRARPRVGDGRGGRIRTVASLPQTARSARLSYIPGSLLTVRRARRSRIDRASGTLIASNPMNTPKIPANAVVMRVIGILGMGLTFSATMYLVDRLGLAERRPDA